MRIIYSILFISAWLFASKVIEIDLSKQKFYAFENSELLFMGDVSTGMQGHKTPRGTFKIIEKDRYHVSNKYPEPTGGAKMPYMLRLTNSGIAIHQGPLPGYPASHGCIRVSKKNAIKLWRWAKLGTRVKIYGDSSKFIAKKRSKKKKKHYTRKKKRYKKKRYSKKRRYQKRHYKKRRVQKKHYVRQAPLYQVIEFYDDY